MARITWRLLCAYLAVSFTLSACLGEIGSAYDSGFGNSDSRADAQPKPSPRPPLDGGSASADAGIEDVVDPGRCGEAGPAIVFFEQRCATGPCHVVGRTYPLLNRHGLAELVNLESRARPQERLVIPGDPNQSWLYRKMAGTQGAMGGSLMPLGTATPIAELGLVESWIRAGAPSKCDEIPESPERPDPNSLDQGQLFTCGDPDAPRNSPARLRRVEREELTHAALRSLAGAWWGSTMKDNPFSANEGLPYSSYSEGLGIDGATLDLYFLNLDEAAVHWSARDPAVLTPPGLRLPDIRDDASVRCIFDETVPDQGCIDSYTTLLLSRGVLFRHPSADEHTRLAGLLRDRIQAEAGDVSLRNRTLRHVAKAAFLMTGALFRSELGLIGTDGRRRLSNDELALALGRILSNHPVGALIPINEPVPEDPDASDPRLGRLGAIRSAAADGTIQDPDVRRQLLRRYGSGIADSRPDLRTDVDGRRIGSRGDYWLAPNFTRFFREFFDYGGANQAFKDTPSATSRWDGSYSGVPMWDPSTLGYGNLQEGTSGWESTLEDQLDDTIAKVVIDTDSGEGDVFRTLLSTRRWHVSSNLAVSSDVPCQGNSDCAAPHPSCSSSGLCSATNWKRVTPMNRVYNLPADVPTTESGRWVDVPSSERFGVLTHPAWLAAHGGNFEDEASLVHRGKWIRETLFCETVPPIELVMVEAQLVPSAPELSARERVRQSTEEGPNAQTCMGCHAKMNSLGAPFESFNHAGFVRAEDHGAPADGSTVISNLPDASLNRSYATTIEFLDALSSSRYARRAFIRQAFRYFMGRDETAADACTLTEMEQALDQNGSFFEMIEALISSETFSHRTVDQGGP